MMRYKT